MAENDKIEVYILTGFLGSGKTTLLNHMLSSPAFSDSAVVVNELGEIGLDHLLVTERADQVALLEGGCLCCAVVDSLPETLLELCRKRAGDEVPAFRRIVIETTGLADPGPILEAIRRSPLLSHFLQLGMVVTVIDMLTADTVPMRHAEALRQIVLADRIVLTKLDQRQDMTPAELTRLHALNPFAEVLAAADIVAMPGWLIAPLASIRPDLPEHVPAHHTHGVEAWSFPVAEAVTRAGLAAFAVAAEHKLGAALLRCKGLVHTARGSVLIQGVGTRFAFAEADARAAEAPPHVTFIVQGRPRKDTASLVPWLYLPEGTMPPSPQDIA